MPDPHPDDERFLSGEDTYGDPEHRPEHVIDEAEVLTEDEEEKVIERLALRAPAICKRFAGALCGEA